MIFIDLFSILALRPASWPSARTGGFPKGNGAGWRWGIITNWTDISGKVIDNMILRPENKKDGQVKMDH